MRKVAIILLTTFILLTNFGAANGELATKSKSAASAFDSQIRENMSILGDSSMYQQEELAYLQQEKAKLEYRIQEFEEAISTSKQKVIQLTNVIEDLKKQIAIEKELIESHDALAF